MKLANRAAILITVCVFLSSLVSTPGYANHDKVNPIVGAVYTMSNDVAGNKIFVFPRRLDGRLLSPVTLETNGLGTSSPLGNQGAIQLDPSQSWLYAVNAGSNTISHFAITNTALQLIGVTDSGGERPISLTVSHNRLYVLNAGGTNGGADSISGFSLGPEGDLTPINGSTQQLSAAYTRPAQIGVSPNGRYLVVSERETHKLTVFNILDDGSLSLLSIVPSQAPTPFGFAFGYRDQIVVAEGALGDDNASSVSSYLLDSTTGLTVVSGAIPTQQTAACWLVLDPSKRHAYTTNPGSDSISAFSIDFAGKLSLKRGTPRRLLRKNSIPLDIVIAPTGNVLYTLLAGTNELAAIKLGRQGQIRWVRQRVTIPNTANGLAIR